LILTTQTHIQAAHRKKKSALHDVKLSLSWSTLNTILHAILHANQTHSVMQY